MLSLTSGFAAWMRKQTAIPKGEAASGSVEKRPRRSSPDEEA